MQCLTIYWGISNTCNLKCSYCYLSEEQKNQKEDYNRLLSATEEFVAKLKEEDVTLYQCILHGAEPGLVPAKTTANMINLLAERSHHKKILMQSSGIYYTPRYMSEIEANCNDEICFFPGFSIDGPAVINDVNRSDGLFKKAWENLERLCESGYHPSLHIVITKNTLSHFNEFCEWILDLENKGIRFSLCPVKSDEQWLSPEEQIILAEWLIKAGTFRHYYAFMPDLCVNKGNNCTPIYFDADGKVFPCNFGRRSDNSFANWKEESIEDIKQKRSTFYADRATSEECDSCELRPRCNSGCPVSRINGKAIDCNVRKYVYSHLPFPPAEVSEYVRWFRTAITRFQWKPMGKIKYGRKT